MRCPNCNAENSERVTKVTHTVSSTRRRRRCQNCGQSRFTREIDEGELTQRQLNELNAERPRATNRPM